MNMNLLFTDVIARKDDSGVKNGRIFLFFIAIMLVAMNSSGFLYAQKNGGEGLPCTGTSIPYFDDMESYPATNYGVEGTIPSCWTLLPGSTNPFFYPRVSTYLAPQGNALLMSSSSSSYGANNYAVLPLFTSKLNGLKMFFDTKMDNTSLGTLTLGYITDINYDSTFHPLITITNSTSVTAHQFSFEGIMIPDSARVAFRWFFDRSMSMSCAIDNVGVEFIPCEPVDSVTVDNVMMTTADVSWVPGDDEPAWKVEYGPAGFAHGAGDTILTVDTNFVQLTNLTGNVEYDLYVRAACEEANQSDYSPVVKFTPYCSVIADTFYVESCDQFEWLGDTFRESGVYVDTLFQAATYSCDSIVILDLSIYPSYNQYDTLEICQNELPYTWRDTTFEVGTDSNHFIFYRHSINSCDSIVNLCLFVDPSYYPLENETICQNDLPYTWRDTVFETGTNSGTYLFTRQTVHGCDSLVTLNLTVNPSYYQTEIEFICQKDLPYTWRDTTFQVGTISGVHTLTRHSQFGCDSVVTFVLIVHPAVDDTVSQSICRSELPFTWQDTTFNVGSESGSYAVHRQTADGCDVIHTLYLTINESDSEEVSLDICDSQLPYTWRDTTFAIGTGSGVYRFQKYTVAGCDSAVTLNLNVNPTFYSDTTVVICHSELPYYYAPQDTTFGEDTPSQSIIHFNMNTTHGCDSVSVLTLIVKPVFKEETSVQICNSELPYAWRDTIFGDETTGGDFTFTRHAVNGCDSTVILHLTVFETSSATVSMELCENELPYLWRDRIIPRGTVSGTYTYSAINENGCDSTAVLQLTIYPTYHLREAVTICRNELPFTWRDTTFYAGTNSGTFLFERRSSNGCDSIVVLQLTVNENFDLSESLSVCENDLPFTWRDTTFGIGTETASFVFHRQTVRNCDSIVTLSLMVYPQYQQTEEQTVCENDLPLYWRDTVFEIGTQSGIYRFSRASVHSCDSVVTLNLTVVPANNEQMSLTICQSDLPYSWNDTVFQVGTKTGDYVFSRAGEGNCIDFLTLHLTVHPSYSEALAEVICQDELPFTWRDTIFDSGSQSGVFQFRRSSVTGCDSIVTFALIINPSYYQTENEVICDNGFPYHWRDTIFEAGTETGDYTFYRQTINGCDSIVTLHLIVNPTYRQTESLVICQNDLPYTWRDTTFQVGTISGIHTFYRYSVHDCDSVVTLALTVNPSYLQTYNVRICQNDLPYSWQDTVFAEGTETGIYSFNYSTAFGCDSIIILDLTVSPSHHVAAELELCSNDLPYQWGNIIFPRGTTDRTFVQTFTSHFGCDSIVDLSLIIHPDYDLVEQLSICENNLPFTWRDTTFQVGTTNGVFHFTRQSQFGCDSAVTLTLLVYPVYSQDITEVICQNDLPFTWRDTTFEVGTQTAVYTFNRLSVSGCDSVVRLHLTVNQSYYFFDTLAICSDELPYTWEGHLFPLGTSSGDMVFYQTSLSGCDSTITLHLTVNPSYTQSEVLNVCANDFPYTWRDTTFEEGTIAGEYVFHRTTISGCDSVVTLSLNIDALPVVAIQGNTTIRLGESTMLVATFGVGNSYLWSNGEQGNFINVSPTENTLYTVTVTNTAGCSDTASILVSVIDTTAIHNYLLASDLLVYPNPANDRVTIKAENEIINQIEIYSMLGSLVERLELHLGEAELDISHLKKGNYLINVLLQNGEIVRKKLIVM